MNLKKRVRNVFRNLEEKGGKVDLVLLRNGIEPHIDISFFYLAGAESGLFEGCSLIAYPNGDEILYTSRLEEESARREGGVSVVAFYDEAHHIELLRKEIGSNVKIGLNAKELTYANFLGIKKEFPDAEFIDVSGAMMGARSVKDSDEIARIRKASKIVSKAFDLVAEELGEGMTERRMASLLNSRMQELGASGPSFETIVAFGPNSAEPHYSPRERELNKGEYALFDFGARYRRYCSDMTRTVVLGRASGRMKSIYETVLEAQGIGIDALRAGEEAKNVHDKVANFIDSTKFRGKFIHSTGHTLGLSVHDGASLSSRSETILEEGMVFTVEPGIYIPNLGGVRIEDDLLVRKGDAEVLTSAPRELIEVEA